MKIGKIEFTWRAHRQACVVKIDGEQRVFDMYPVFWTPLKI